VPQQIDKFGDRSSRVTNGKERLRHRKSHTIKHLQSICRPGNPYGEFRSIKDELQRRALMHCDVIGLVASDFVLRIVTGGMMHMAFIVDVSRMHFNNDAANPACFRVPANVISDLESPRHGFASEIRTPTKATLARTWNLPVCSE
jgi:hypothetical protein